MAISTLNVLVSGAAGGRSLWYCSNGPVAFRKWMQIECCCISFDLFLDPRPSTFRHTGDLEPDPTECVNNSRRWQTGPWSFWAQKIGGFYRPLFGYRKSIPAFFAIVEFQIMCHGVTSLHKLWTPLQGRSRRGNRPWGALVWGVEIGTDWTGHFRHKQ